MKIQSSADQQLFAEICGFYQQFADIVNIGVPDFEELQAWLVKTGSDVAPGLIQVHKSLLLKNKIFAKKHKNWEWTLKEFCCSFFRDGADALVNEGGYGNLDLTMRLKILRALQDTLFERSGKLANYTKEFTDDMRAQHLGRDRLGLVYLLVRSPANQIFQIYKVVGGCSYFVACNRCEVFNLIKRLSQKRIPADSAAQWDEKQLIEFLNVLAFAIF